MKKITRRYLRKFLEEHATKSEVLEIGGGRVNTNHSYEDIFPNRHTFDIDPKRNPDTIGDAHDLPFNDCSFENILCTEVLEHLHSPWVAITEMHRVLKPGGRLILTTRFVYPIHDAPHDYFRFTEYGLKSLFKEWDIEVLTTETKTFSSLAALFQRVIFQTDVVGGKITKGFLYLVALLLERLDWLLKVEYGDIGKTSKVTNIITTGYYMVAKKKGK